MNLNIWTRGRQNNKNKGDSWVLGRCSWSTPKRNRYDWCSYSRDQSSCFSRSPAWKSQGHLDNEIRIRLQTFCSPSGLSQSGKHKLDFGCIASLAVFIVELGDWGFRTCVRMALYNNRTSCYLRRFRPYNGRTRYASIYLGD